MPLFLIVPALYVSAGTTDSTTTTFSGGNSQTISLLDGSSFDPLYGQGGAYISVVENSLTVDSLVSYPSSVNTDEGGDTGSVINTYVVQNGDTISGIAEKFSVSQNTIVWANDLRGSTIRVGQELVILPISGVLHTVAKGDSLKKLAKYYDTELEYVLSYNGLEESTLLEVGAEITVPYGTIPKPKVIVRAPTRSPGKTYGNSTSGATAKVWNNTRTVYHNGVKTTALRNTGGPTLDNYYIRPVNGYPRSRGLHGNNGIDWAAPKGTPVAAAAAGTVSISKYGGWNGGYGKYVVVNHHNGTQTLYAHMSSVNVVPGQNVAQGQLVGRVGTTGNSTGNHLHFEVRGAKNPFR